MKQVPVQTETWPEMHLTPVSSIPCPNTIQPIMNSAHKNIIDNANHQKNTPKQISKRKPTYINTDQHHNRAIRYNHGIIDRKVTGTRKWVTREGHDTMI